MITKAMIALLSDTPDLGALGRLRRHSEPGDLPVIIEKTSGLIVDRRHFAAGYVTAGFWPVSSCWEQVTSGGGVMASGPRVPKAELTGIYGAVVKRMSRKMFGEVPEPVEVAWHNRKVVNFSFSLGRKVQQWDRCEANLKSFAHMAVASLVGCSFCLDLGYFQARNEGLDVVKAREVPRWRESDVFTPLERDVMEYAEAMTQTPPVVTDELSARLLAALGPAALVELTMVAALANFAARSNTALGIESQEFSAACGLKPLASAGRGVRSPT